MSMWVRDAALFLHCSIRMIMWHCDVSVVLHDAYRKVHINRPKHDSHPRPPYN